MDIERTIDIAAPQERVWRVMTDVERWHEWTASILGVERLDDNSFDLGARFRVRQPRLPPAVWTVSVCDPPNYFEWRNVAPGVRSVGGHRARPAEGPGAVRATLSIDWNGPLAPLIRLLFGGLSRRYVTMEAEGLKRRCEEWGER